MGSLRMGSTPIFYSSSPSSLFVSPEELRAFHNIDRILYTRLVFNLNRDPAQSVQVMAFWIWLERAKRCGHLVHKMLPLPDTVINALADEAALCLRCVESDQFQFSSDSNNIDLPLTRSLSNTGISLRDFHENRPSVLRGIMMIVNEVCIRAFDDILLQALLDERRHSAGFVNSPVIDPVLHVTCSDNNNIRVVVGGDPNCVVSLQHKEAQSTGGLGLHNDIGLSQTISAGDNVTDATDDKTLFLTFSKGYPISEDEVRAFFTRKYGDCIEGIYMQEVLGEEQQQLYARLVVRSPATIQTLLEGRSKAKFAINGKHVWARKYVPKNTMPSSPLVRASSPPSPSPA